MRPLYILLIVTASTTAAIAQNPGQFSLIDAINQAVRTSPTIKESAANRRATEAELRQTQGTLLPQIRLQALVGPERLDRDIIPVPVGNGVWHNGREYSVVVRQVLFDGFSSINEIWRQAARVDAAALRVLERSELIALDATEAYIDVVRYMRLITLANENFGAHRRIFQNVKTRYDGGRASEGDLQQARERVSAVEAVVAEFKQNLDNARAKYRKVVGLEPFGLYFPGRLLGLPISKDESLAITLRNNPTIQAAAADREAARYGFHATGGAFVPNVSLEGKALRGYDTSLYAGQRDELSGKVVVTWDIFRGGQDAWKRVEMSERMIEQTERHARLQRDAFESIDKAWAARTITSERAAALLRQVDAARSAVTSFTKEYDLGQRTLYDLLNAENQLFNALVSLVSTRSVAVFADYQLLAAMGHLLNYLKTARPADAEPLETRPFGVFPTKLPPILLNEPGPGSEPFKVIEPLPYGYAPGQVGPLDAPKSQKISTIDEIWLVRPVQSTPDRVPARQTRPTAVAAVQPATPVAERAPQKISNIVQIFPRELAYGGDPQVPAEQPLMVAAAEVVEVKPAQAPVTEITEAQPVTAFATPSSPTTAAPETITSIEDIWPRGLRKLPPRDESPVEAPAAKPETTTAAAVVQPKGPVINHIDDLWPRRSSSLN